MKDGGVPQVGEVTCGGLPHLTCKRDHIKMRDYMDRGVTSPTWGPPPPCKQALNLLFQIATIVITNTATNVRQVLENLTVMHSSVLVSNLLDNLC